MQLLCGTISGFRLQSWHIRQQERDPSAVMKGLYPEEAIWLMHLYAALTPKLWVFAS